MFQNCLIVKKKKNLTGGALQHLITKLKLDLCYLHI